LLQTRTQVVGNVRLRATALFKSLLPGSQIGIYCRLVSQVVGDCAVQLLEAESRKIVSDGFGGVTVEEAADYRVERHARTPDKVARFTLFHVCGRHRLHQAPVYSPWVRGTSGVLRVGTSSKAMLALATAANAQTSEAARAAGCNPISAKATQTPSSDARSTPACQATDSECRSKPTPENRGRLFRMIADRGRLRSSAPDRFANSCKGF